MNTKQTSGESLAKAAQCYIETHSKDKFSLSEMAGALFVNGSYLLRIFRRYTGTTPLAYHHRVRCGKAKELLLRTDTSISEIGEAVGFTTPSHFSHIFRETEGCTPSEYRARHKRDPQEEAERWTDL